MNFLPAAKFCRNALLILLGLFLLSRILTLSAFPIFNDEAIYLQYAQRIHDDWQKNKFISMDGEFTDWKPPLMYWLAAPVIEWGNDPLIAGRALALLVSIAGFFGFYLFAKELFGEKEGVLSALLYLLCPTVLFHNNQFIAETFLVSTAPFLYWALLKGMRREKSEWWVWALSALLFGAALLLFKQSGFLLLAIAGLLPFSRLRTNEPGRYEWRATALNVALVIAVIVGARLAADAMLPSAFNATRDRFNSKWVMPVSEVLRFPVEIWQVNLAKVADYIGSYYTWLAAILSCWFTWLALRRKNFPELTLAGMCLAGAVAVTFLLRGFNEYMLNTALIVALLPFLGRMAVSLYDSAPLGKATLLLRRALLTLGALTLIHWGYQDALMGMSPGRYIERSTPWAIRNYLTSWSTGFGVKEIVSMLEKEKRPGVIFADTQWGNPRTALEVYGKERFPNLRIQPFTREFLDSAETRKLRDLVSKIKPVHFAIYSADSSGERLSWLNNVHEHMCATRQEIKEYPSQAPLIFCSF
ncbi:MAG TPA: glycosyltransferase family 39 protein [Chthoniobacterales bacterium]|nr:glycosyltransferase family 39 protein [Chthoniobacterales bacterium]